MYAQDLVDKFTELIAEHGNLPVVDEYDREIDSPEFNNDTSPCFVVGFDETD